MSKQLKRILALAIPLACASVFVRLGVWQLQRLAERREFNRLLASRAVAQPIDVKSLTTDTAAGHYRRVTAAGTFDYRHQVVYAGRSRQGSPGVYLLTPLRIGGGDSLVMVNRGWVYSPDAAAVDESRWQEGDSAKVTGYVETYVKADPHRPAKAPNRVHALDRETIEQLTGGTLSPYIIVRTDTAPSPVSLAGAPPRVDSTPARLEMPPLDEGPHQSYAFQWFAFATIAVVGGVALFRKSR